MEIYNYTDNELNELMLKYKEKQQRYNQMYNECTERNEKIIFHIHKEMIRRSVNNNLSKIIDKMDITE
jgi:hypothetical protein